MPGHAAMDSIASKCRMASMRRRAARRHRHPAGSVVRSGFCCHAPPADPMLLDASQSQLVLVDYQTRLMAAIPEADAVLRNAVRLAQLAQWLEVPAWGTEQNPSRLGENPPEIRTLCRNTLAKMHFSGMEEGLGEWLRAPAPQAPRGNARSL